MLASSDRLARLVVAAATIVIAALAGTLPALAAHPGFVDGSFLSDYASDRGTLVEVTLDRPLLELIAGPAASYDEAAGELAKKLESVRAMVVTLDEGAEAEVLAEIRTLRERLEATGWQSVARVRDGSDDVSVLVKSEGDALVGVTVLVLSGTELVFTNVAGVIDTEQLRRLAASYDIPGLDALPQVP